jgi:hypothetical protein
VKYRCTACWCVVAAAIGLSGLSPRIARAQAALATPSAKASSWTAARTPWGHPDLQGVWNNATSTPLERTTAEEKEVARRAQAPVRAATDGTGAGWLEPGKARGVSLVVDPPDGRIPMTDAAVKRLVAREEARRGRGEADSWLDRNSWERCISRTLPTAMIPNAYNANYQILQTPDYVVILVEMIHDARVIPLDGRPHAAQNIRMWMGDSRGRWEGNTLVVETTNFNDKLDGGPLQPSHVIQTGYRGTGETLRLVERFTRVDATTIDYRFTVEDPKTFTRPYTVSIPMTKNDEQMGIHEYACHEGNYAMVNLLKAGRANEKGAIEAAERVRRQRVEAGHPGVREPAAPIVPLTESR